MIERKALIFNVQKYNMYDGPGVRTIVFFKGCPLRCQWCSNPESQLRHFEIMLKRNQCVSCGSCAKVCPAGLHSFAEDGTHLVDRSKECLGCGRCVEACLPKALALSGERRSISDLMSVVEEDTPFYETSGGGLTVGGGECTMQPEALCNLLESSHQKHINTAIETCGYVRSEVLARIAPHVDLFLFDIKHMDPERHKELTGAHNALILQNLRWLLENRYNVRIRMPLLKGVNDGERELSMLMEFLRPYRNMKNLKGIDLLPYHKLGVGKYSQLDRSYPIQGDPSLSDEDLERLESYVQRFSFPVTVIRH
ncbi:MAG: choline TMA-lyase-activating enzyme [Desulfovibrionaceae bacterium]|nr:choline TMA-lyase-activating enzyme [Desulfovibrionaceae bacterium]